MTSKRIAEIRGVFCNRENLISHSLVHELADEYGALWDAVCDFRTVVEKHCLDSEQAQDEYEALMKVFLAQPNVEKTL